jgi:hypothetical protein
MSSFSHSAPFSHQFLGTLGSFDEALFARITAPLRRPEDLERRLLPDQSKPALPLIDALAILVACRTCVAEKTKTKKTKKQTRIYVNSKELQK